MILRTSLLIAFALVSPKSFGDFKIVIDPGHGGRDRGATFHDLVEAQLTLKMGELLKKTLSKDRKIQVILTRTEDTFVSLEDRVLKANQVGADAFLSLHFNSSPDAKAQGSEFYFHHPWANDEETMFLAHRENRSHLASSPDTKQTESKSAAELLAIVQDLKRHNFIKQSAHLSETFVDVFSLARVSKRTTVRQGPFFVLYNVEAPSVLAELGYLSNVAESKKLKNPMHLETLAEKLGVAISKFQESLDKISR